ncbi:hypothetical protein A9Q84_09640 [Halobacteriovorax marinus]|uniref:ABC transporter domain-containing protein n=1 Tax=Halobacteriovorax marinus TaxID=97084 RepID=A0A1Y5F6S1_9BACT|nr:hypothetical protein A9Q84_09640 [Halobacteriovorax marinus]
MSNCIEITNFTKKYDLFTAVDDITLSVTKGSIFGLLGPNGAGKTTTIKAMTGRLRLTAGEISILGLDVTKDIKKIHQQIGVVSESQNLYEHLSVFENIDFFRQLYNIEKNKTDQIIKTLSLEHKRDNRVSGLSKGLKQRVLLARSILHSPKLLFLDEPTSGLDPSSAKEVLEFIHKIKELGTSVFLTTHNMEEADLLCDKIAFINKGSIVAVGTPKTLKDQFGNSDVEVTYRENGHEKTEIHSLEEKSIFHKISEIHQAHQILSIHSREATMNDVFLNIVEHSKEQQ